MPNCIFCNDESKVVMPDYIKMCDECREKGKIAGMDLDKPDNHFLCRECDTICSIEELGYTDGFCMVCKICSESELKNGTEN